MRERHALLAWRLGDKVARFRQINKGRSNVHHDALEFPDGKTVLLMQLCKGQHAACCSCQRTRVSTWTRRNRTRRS
jgi:hypothetical protein